MLYVNLVNSREMKINVNVNELWTDYEVIWGIAIVSYLTCCII